MRRTDTRLGALLVAGAGILLCALALVWPEPQVRHPFALAVGVWPGMESLTLAREHGLLTEADVNFVELSWTSATMMAFENRVVDGAVVTLDEMLRLKAGGHSIKAVLVMASSNGGDAIIARASIPSLQALKGRRVGVELRASGEYFLTRALQSASMQLSDVIIVPLNLAEAENAYDQNEVDALVTTDPSRTRLVAKGARILLDSAAPPEDLYRLLVVREDFLEARPEMLSKLVNAHFAMIPVLHAQPPAPGMDAVLRRQQLGGPQYAACLDRLTHHSREANLQLLSPGAAGLEPVLQQISTLMKDTGLLEQEATWTGLLDASLIEKGAR